MTVCIGALCADTAGTPAKAVVVASDRMVTLGGLIEFEHEVPKVNSINDHAVALIAGDALRGSRLVRELIRKIPTGAPSIQQVVELAASLYVDLRRKQIESEIFTPRGMSIQHFYQGQQQQLIGQLAAMLDSQVIGFNYGATVLFAGIDDTGAHLYSLDNPGGSFEDHQTIGFSAIGSGALAALQSMIGFGHTPMGSLAETVYRVYVSKCRAEVAPGVGRDTDLIVIRSSGRINVDQEAIGHLQRIHEQHQQPMTKDLKEQLAQLPIFQKENEQ